MEFFDMDDTILGLIWNFRYIIAVKLGRTGSTESIGPFNAIRAEHSVVLFLSSGATVGARRILQIV